MLRPNQAVHLENCGKLGREVLPTPPGTHVTHHATHASRPSMQGVPDSCGEGDVFSALEQFAGLEKVRLVREKHTGPQPFCLSSRVALPTYC